VRGVPLLVLVLLAAAAPRAAAEGETAPPPAPPPAAERKPAEPKAALEKTGPEALALIAVAAERQGSGPTSAAAAVTAFRITFSTVVVYTAKGDKYQASGSTETFAFPDRVRSEWAAEGKRTTTGHSGRVGWVKRDGEAVRVFSDPEGRDREDVRDLEQRRRMLRLVHRAFFLGNLAAGDAPVRLLPDGPFTPPSNDAAAAKPVPCHHLVRPATAEDPEVHLYLGMEEKDPVAAVIPPEVRADGSRTSSWVLTVAYDEEEPKKAKLPEGLKVPFWLELFEVPPAAGARPVLRIQAGVESMVIDPAAIPDSVFRAPKE